MIVNRELLPDEEEIIIEKHHTCPYHRKHLEDKDYAGCGCSSVYATKIVKKKWNKK